MRPYRWGGFTLLSPFPLPRLHPGTGYHGQIVFRQSPDEPPPEPTADRRTVRFLDGTTTQVSAGPDGADLVVRLSGVGTFVVRPHEVVLHREPGASDDDVEHFLVNAVLSNLAGLRGELCPHAAAVARDGRALVVAGPSGSGKSHLAARLVADGWSLLADDHVVIRPDDGRWLAYPGARTVRVEGLEVKGAWPNRGKGEAVVAASAEPAAVETLVLLTERGPEAEAANLTSLLAVQGGWRWTDEPTRRSLMDAAARLLSDVQVRRLTREEAETL